VDLGPALSGARLHRITAGNNHTCAASTTVAYCWGLNSSGQLGDGSTADGTGPAPVETRTSPDPPTAVTATAGDGLAQVSWTAPANGAAGRYRVTASPGEATCTSSTTSCTVTGLVNGTAYTFTVVARNAYGRSAPSAKSNPATPFVAPEPRTPVKETQTPAPGKPEPRTPAKEPTASSPVKEPTGDRAPTPSAAPAASPVKEPAGDRAPTPSAVPAAPARPSRTPSAEAARQPDPPTPLTTDDYDATPLLIQPEPPPPWAAPPTLPDVPSQMPPDDSALARTTAARAAAEPAQVATVVLGMALLVVVGTAAVAYRGRRRAP
jgi:hypothetical protein